MELIEGDLDDYAGLTQPKFKGKIFRVFDKAEIGFVFIELFEIEKQKQGTFHSFILPGYRNAHTGLEFLKEVFSLAFGDLGLEKLYTMANKRQEIYLNWCKRMKNENRQILGYTVFSLTKEKYLCQ